MEFFGLDFDFREEDLPDSDNPEEDIPEEFCNK